ncbi:MAG: efflux RND transporter periplasmic adaptor subunit [Methylophilales bacterium]|nr:efflux RND transporter periplasmic adaptor subunit [Methylophilales bacterium]
MSRIVKKSIPLLILLFLIGASVYFYQKSKVLLPEKMYRLQPVSQGDVVQTVSANGTLNPVTLINVGAQVSGRVNKLFVDFNDHVEKNQILLTLEPELFNAQIGQSQGNVRNAQASVELAIANEARMRALFTQDYASKQDLDQAVQALKSARAQLETARGQLLRDNTNLSYSIIRSPVSGVVVDRVVDVGQTVAASFQTPTLIKIAQDLSKMQINTSFAEADIGNIKVGQKAKFSVDAFQSRIFEGTVKQLRLNPTVITNVVTYDVVISVDNPEKILLPGMTAYVNIMVSQHDNVMLTPNAALRFKPKQDDNQTSSASSADAKNHGQHGGKKKPGQEDLLSGKVYVIRDGKLTPIRISLGISDGHFTEFTSKDIKLNDQVIVGENQANDTSSPSASSMKFRMF